MVARYSGSHGIRGPGVGGLTQCATGNPVPVTVDSVTFFRSGSGPVPAKY